MNVECACVTMSTSRRRVGADVAVGAPQLTIDDGRSRAGVSTITRRVAAHRRWPVEQRIYHLVLEGRTFKCRLSLSSVHAFV